MFYEVIEDDDDRVSGESNNTSTASQPNSGNQQAATLPVSKTGNEDDDLDVAFVRDIHAKRPDLRCKEAQYVNNIWARDPTLVNA